MDEAEKAARRALAIQKLARVFSKAGCLPSQHREAIDNRARDGPMLSVDIKQGNLPNAARDVSCVPVRTSEDGQATAFSPSDITELEFLLQLLGALQPRPLVPSSSSSRPIIQPGGPPPHTPLDVRQKQHPPAQQGTFLAGSPPQPRPLDPPRATGPCDHDHDTRATLERVARLIRARITDLSVPMGCQGRGPHASPPMTNGRAHDAPSESGEETDVRNGADPQGARVGMDMDMVTGTRLERIVVEGGAAVDGHDTRDGDGRGLPDGHPPRHDRAAAAREGPLDGQGLRGGSDALPGSASVAQPSKPASLGASLSASLAGAVPRASSAGDGAAIQVDTPRPARRGAGMKLGALLRDIALGKALLPNPSVSTARFWESLSGGRMSVGRPHPFGHHVADAANPGDQCLFDSHQGGGGDAASGDVCQAQTGRVDVGRAQALLDEQGYVATRPFTPDEWKARGVDLDAMLHTMNALVRAGWPPAFIFMYDMAWTMVDVLFSYMCHFVGPTQQSDGILLEPSNFAWALRPTAAKPSPAVAMEAAMPSSQGVTSTAQAARGDVGRLANAQLHDGVRRGVGDMDGAAAGSQRGTLSGDIISGIRPSPAGNNFGLPHRDYSYAESWLEPQAPCEPPVPSLLSVWVPLNDATINNGCLFFLPKEFDLLWSSPDHPAHMLAATPGEEEHELAPLPSSLGPPSVPAATFPRRILPSGEPSITRVDEEPTLMLKVVNTSAPSPTTSPKGLTDPALKSLTNGQTEGSAAPSSTPLSLRPCHASPHAVFSHAVPMTEIRFPLGGARPAPVGAGSVMCWHGNTVHWGSAAGHASTVDVTVTLAASPSLQQGGDASTATAPAPLASSPLQTGAAGLLASSLLLGPPARGHDGDVVGDSTRPADATSATASARSDPQRAESAGEPHSHSGVSRVNDEASCTASQAWAGGTGEGGGQGQVGLVEGSTVTRGSATVADGRLPTTVTTASSSAAKGGRVAAASSSPPVLPRRSVAFTFRSTAAPHMPSLVPALSRPQARELLGPVERLRYVANSLILYSRWYPVTAALLPEVFFSDEK